MKTQQFKSKLMQINMIVGERDSSLNVSSESDHMSAQVR
jgi:hypothetical protein